MGESRIGWPKSERSYRLDRRSLAIERLVMGARMQRRKTVEYSKSARRSKTATLASHSYLSEEMKAGNFGTGNP